MRTLASLVAISMAAVFSVAGSSVANATSQQETNTAVLGEKTVTVVSGDSLSKIATANSTTYQRLFFANTNVEHPDLIFPGEQLRVPAAEEQLVERPLPSDVVVPNEVPAPVAAAPQVSAPIVEEEVYVAPDPAPVSAPAVATGSVWDSLAQCESGGNWAINTGNGFYGGLQFTLSSWQAVGGTGYPHQASREEQIMRAEKLLALQGWGAWPACTSKLGLR